MRRHTGLSGMVTAASLERPGMAETITVPEIVRKVAHHMYRKVNCSAPGELHSCQTVVASGAGLGHVFAKFDHTIARVGPMFRRHRPRLVEFGQVGIELGPMSAKIWPQIGHCCSNSVRCWTAFAKLCQTMAQIGQTCPSLGQISGLKASEGQVLGNLLQLRSSPVTP